MLLEPVNLLVKFFGEEADELRRRGGDGGEYGATTGRPRRMGWFDAVASRYGCRIQGATEVALTVLDVLGYLDELPVCVGYEIDGKVTKDFPTTASLKKAKPVYEVLPGWKTDIRGLLEYDKLPENCRKYIEFIEKELGVPVKLVSMDREDMRLFIDKNLLQFLVPQIRRNSLRLVGAFAR